MQNEAFERRFMSGDRSDTHTFAAVIPAWNAIGTLQRAIESVLSQTRPPDEVIVCDDGSEDGTAELAREFEPDVLVVSIPHSGPSSARNAAGAEARSEFIAYLDSDDVWVPEKLETFEDAICSLDSPDTLVSDFRRRSKKTGEWRPLSNTDIFPFILTEEAQQEGECSVPFRVFDPIMAFRILLKGYPIWPSSLLVRRKLLEDVGGWNPEFPRAQDFDLMLRLVANGGLVYLDAPLTTVHEHQGHGALYDYVSRQLDWDIKVLQANARPESGLDEGFRALARNSLGERLIYRGDHSRRHRRRLEALRWYIRALSYRSQWIRGPFRILETLLYADRLREDRAADLERMPPESEPGVREARKAGHQP
jgi:glycosyltransferase involved in cell wall biosynthesis